MTYYLFKNMTSGEPMEILAFPHDEPKAEIQEWIDTFGLEYIEKEGRDPQSVAQWADAYTYILHKLATKYWFSLVEWDNENNLYY